MGRSGAGPGEMTRPSKLFVTPAGVVHVIDPSKRSIIRFGPDGATVDELPLPRVRANQPQPGPNGGLFAYADTAADPGGQARSGSMSRRVLSFHPAAGDPIEIANMDWAPGVASGNAVTPPSCGMRLMMPQIFQHRPDWRSAGDRVLYNSSAEYVIDVAVPGGDRTSIRRDVPVFEATRELAAAEIGGRFQAPESDPCYLPPEDMADLATWLDIVPWIKDVASTPDGTVLVLRRAPGESAYERIDVFRPDGTYAGTLPPDFPFSAVWRSEKELIRIERDELGRIYVVVDRVIR
jgi:hypothetical protein